MQKNGWWGLGRYLCGQAKIRSEIEAGNHDRSPHRVNVMCGPFGQVSTERAPCYAIFYELQLPPAGYYSQAVARKILAVRMVFAQRRGAKVEFSNLITLLLRGPMSRHVRTTGLSR